jgi:glycosyltransferase involved in cell wall biosynthesis
MLGAGALQFSRWKKCIFSALVQERALAAVTCFHATSVRELEDIRAYGLSSPVAVIPNGVDVTPAEFLKTNEVSETAARTVLYIGRLHPKKGIDRLLNAWASVEENYPEWRLRIVGPSDGKYSAALRRLASSLKLARVDFHDALFGEDKNAAYRDADIFVLPSLDENFGMVVAEALANGTPVIASKNTPWSGLVEERCGWWPDNAVAPLAAVLGEAMALPRASLDAMGARGRDWMLREFSWSRVAADMEAVYRWVLGEGERPQCIMMS